MGLQLYVGLIRPCMEYCSHIWGAHLLFRCLTELSQRPSVLLTILHLLPHSTHSPYAVRWPLFLSFYRYYFSRCSLELASCIPPPLERPRNTRQSANAHRYSVSIANSRLNSFDNCFFPSTSKLWNSLPESVFPDLYNLSSFKRQVYRHLRGG